MTIDALRMALATSTTPTTGLTGGATTQTEPGPVGKDMFLKLLVAQLKFQNPTEPVDSSQFLAQTAQFTMVERIQELAARIDALVSGEASQRAAGLLGRQVTYLDAEGAEQTGVVTGTRFGPDGPVLRLGTEEISLTDVRNVELATS